MGPTGAALPGDSSCRNTLWAQPEAGFVAWGTAKCHDDSHRDYQKTSPVTAVCA
jgi:hypothetical protein